MEPIQTTSVYSGLVFPSRERSHSSAEKQMNETFGKRRLEKDHLHETIREIFERSEETMVPRWPPTSLTPDRLAFDELPDGAREILQETYSDWSSNGTCRRTESPGGPMPVPQQHSNLHDPGSLPGFLGGIASRWLRFRLFGQGGHREPDDFADRSEACRRCGHA